MLEAVYLKLMRRQFLFLNMILNHIDLFLRFFMRIGTVKWFNESLLMTVVQMYSYISLQSKVMAFVL